MGAMGVRWVCVWVWVYVCVKKKVCVDVRVGASVGVSVGAGMEVGVIFRLWVNEYCNFLVFSLKTLLLFAIQS